MDEEKKKLIITKEMTGYRRGCFSQFDSMPKYKELAMVRSTFLLPSTRRKISIILMHF